MTSKIFFLGYNKTATCSIYQLMTTNGIKCQHDSKWDIDKYQAFCDCGDLQDYKKLYEMYPNAYFILNTRNIKDWLLSRLKHGFTYKQREFGYPAPSFDIVEKWLIARLEYYKELKEYFKDKNNFYILDIDKFNWKNNLANILNLKTSIAKDAHITPYNKVFEQYKILVETVCELYKI